MPRHKKNETILQLEGTYRADRHSNRDESKIASILQIPPECPKNIKNKMAREAWELMIQELTNTHRLASEDVPELEIAFSALADVYEMRKVQKKFKGLQKASEEYARVISIITKREQRFQDIIGLYGISSQKRLALLGMAGGLGKKKSLAERMTE